MAGHEAASQACHTCRRRRRKCDRKIPQCQKCTDDGLDCLGYGKLILWERGVASRGKMMNRTFSQASSDKPQMEVSLFQSSESSNKTAKGQPSLAISSVESCETSSLRPALLDPFIQELSSSERYYFFHSANVLVRFYVFYDLPGKNPMRQLMSTLHGSSVLFYAFVSNAAFHIHNLSSTRPVQFRAQIQDAPPMRQHETDDQANPLSDLAAMSLRHALLAKQKTLSLLGQSLQSFDPVIIDIMLATIVVLLNHELLEAGKDSWKVHIQGAQQLIAMLGGFSGHWDSQDNPLRMFCLGEFLVLSILGTTLTHSSDLLIYIPPCINLDSLLLFTERYNYLSCPAPLLKLMLRSLEIPNTGSGQAFEKLTCSQMELLILEALSFEPREWLKTLEPTGPWGSLERRFHTASALKSAVCLFLVRRSAATSAHIDARAANLLVDTEHHVEEIIHHVSFIAPDDAILQSTCWPVFLVGLVTQSPTKRVWVRERLNALWDHMHWGYICTAQEVLDIIWSSPNDSGNKNLTTTKYLIC